VPVVLDANVLFPASLRDTLLRTAAEGLFRPAWTATIWDEVLDNLTTKPRNPMPPAAAAHLRAEVLRHFPDAAVMGYEDLIPSLTNDEKDRHVLAAAVHAQARQIVTCNLKHFPERALAPYGITALEPDEFLMAIAGPMTERVTRIIREQAAALKRPSATPARILGTLAQHAPTFVAFIRPLIEGRA